MPLLYYYRAIRTGAKPDESRETKRRERERERENERCANEKKNKETNLYSKEIAGL